MTDLLTIVLPYFNEEGWIGKTVASLSAQNNQRFKLLLIDNGSTDGGSAEAMEAGKSFDTRIQISACAIPGKTSAMAHGLELVHSPYVAICDADTVYPEDYVKRIITLFEQHGGAAAVMAINLYGTDENRANKRKAFIMRKSRRFSGKCHAGGYAQAFRTDALKAAGGFDTQIWPYVLEDHEIVHRVHEHGHSVYHPDHVCYPSGRRTSRDRVSWNTLERLMYRYMPERGMDWFFYSFLGPRFAERNCMAVALREKQWEAPVAENTL